MYCILHPVYPIPRYYKPRCIAGLCIAFFSLFSYLAETYWTNPQYRVTITDADDDDDEEIGTIIVGLMQKGRRKLKEYGEGNLTMGYDIYRVDN